MISCMSVSSVHFFSCDLERVSPGVTEGKEEIMACDIDKEEKVLVIMHGDEKPTFIVEELSSASTTDSSQV